MATAQNQSHLVHVCKVLVEQCSLGVANVQVARGLRWKTSHDLALDGIWKANLKGATNICKHKQ